MTVRANKPAFNIREKLKELERPIGVKGNELMRAETAQEARDLVSAGRKNLIINGDFSISQRGGYTSSTSMINNTYYLDRWFSDHGNTVTATFRQITTDLPKEYRNLSNTGLRFEATSSNASAYLGFRQRYEFMSGLDGKYVTVSAWVKSNRQAVIINYDGSGAPYDYAQHSGGGGWEYLSYTTHITSTSHNYFDIFIIDTLTYGYMQINSGDYVEVTNYQVEVGKNATDFEHRSYGEELALCERYFQKYSKGSLMWASPRSPQGTYTDLTYGVFKYRAPMRAVPTVGIIGSNFSGVRYNGSGYSSSNIALSTNTGAGYTTMENAGADSTTIRIQWGFNWTINDLVNVVCTNTDSALTFSAEL